MRVLVTGSRTWPRPARVSMVLDELRQIHPRLIVVHGFCRRGVDQMADEWALRNTAGPERWPADWARYGNRAGMVRNAMMVRAGADLCLAFIDWCRSDDCNRVGLHGSHGASNCARQAEQAGIETWRFTPPAAKRPAG